MSHFAVTIKRILAIDPHPNADAIEFAVIDGYRSIVKKGQFAAGDLVAYLPEAALLPEWVLKAISLWDEEKACGKLSGKAGNRVKAIKLRGELSQGICYACEQRTFPDPDGLGSGEHLEWVLPLIKTEVGIPGCIIYEGFDATQLMGITKYEPPIPVALSGEVFNAGQHLTVAFDVENWKSYPGIIQDGEEVIFTEKLHGTFTGISVLPLTDAHPDAFGKNKNILVFSKGLGAQGLVFKNNDKNANNVYVRTVRALLDAIDAKEWYPSSEPDILMGETFGPGIQDLAYGKDLELRLFARAIGYRGEQRYQDFDSVSAVADHLGVSAVPVLYRGPFSLDVMLEHTDGETTMDAEHIREGIVMTPVFERRDPSIGRVCLKSVSADYLTRKGGTEHN